MFSIFVKDRGNTKIRTRSINDNYSTSSVKARITVLIMMNGKTVFMLSLEKNKNKKKTNKIFALK